ncbi:hypothetical protein NIES4102_25430 [Chondrocystis sp. NIES-4102]|nr:hypothetical protein NIES4102_25430 [Chondrocystis sp. NIES-4102]
MFFRDHQKLNIFNMFSFAKIWRLLLFICLISLVLLPNPGYSKGKKAQTTRLPPAPDTGSPEDDFAAGGTRGGDQLTNNTCNQITKDVVYLLGDRNRDFTASAYPSFWFHVPENANKINKMKFLVTELATGKRIYTAILSTPQPSGIIGIALPPKAQYALSPKVNYTWSLQIDCAGTKQEIDMALSGWLSRQPSNQELQTQLANSSNLEKYAVYVQHNLLYDALTHLAQSRINKPNDPDIAFAWTDLLSQLGWQHLLQPSNEIKLSIVDTRIVYK